MADDGMLGTIGDVAGDVLETVGEEVKKIGKTAVSQITGRPQDQNAPAASDLKAMQKGDRQFSQKGEAEVKAKIAQIYAEYAAKRAREQKQEAAVQQQQEQEKTQVLEQAKKQEVITTPVAKTRAEIKNYGAE